MSDGNYIKISRRILDWEWWMDMNTTRVFIYMIIRANWKEGKFKGIDIPRGSFAASIASISDGTGLTNDEVRTAIKHLLKSGNITKQSTNKYTVFSVVGYDSYQDSSQSNPKQSPSYSQAIPNDRRKKEGNNISLCERAREGPMRFNDFWNTYPKKVNMLNAQGEYTYVLETTAELSEDDLITAAANYAEYCTIRCTKERYIKNPDNWLKESVWIDFMPEKYQKPKSEDRLKSNNRFNNFDQREYDFDDLERSLQG